MPVQTRSRARQLRAVQDEVMHFASQTDAESYLLSKEIKSTETMRETRFKRRKLDDLRAQQNALQSPVYKLPDDILRMIILLVCDGPRKQDPTQVAMVLSHVVSRWRTVVLSMPKLWTHIFVKPRIHPRILIDRLESFVARSIVAPLSVTVELTDLFDALDGNQLMSLADILCRKVYPKCERLSLKGSVVWCSKAQSLAPGLFSFQLCPRLRTLSLAEIEFTPNRTTQLLVSLQSCINLKELALRRCDVWVEDTTAVYQIPSLRRFTSLGDGAVMLLANLILPSVVEWKLGDAGHDQIESAVLKLLWPKGALQTSLPSLQRLTLKCTLIIPDPIAHLLAELPGLQRFFCQGVFFMGSSHDSESSSTSLPIPIVNPLISKPTSAPPSSSPSLGLPTSARIAALEFDACHAVPWFLETLLSPSRDRPRPAQARYSIRARACSRPAPDQQRWLEQNVVSMQWSSIPSRTTTPLL